MGFVLLFIYIVLTITGPAEVFRQLAPLRLAYWTGVLGLLCSAGFLMTRAGRYTRLPQFWSFLGLVCVMCVSTVWAERWLGASTKVLTSFSVPLTMFFLILLTVDTLKKMNWIAFAIAISAVLLSTQGMASYLTNWDAWRVLMVYADEGKGQDKINRDDLFQAAEAELVAQGDRQGLQELYAVAKSAAIRSGDISVRIRGNGIMQDPNDLAMGLVTSLPFLWMAYRRGRRMRNLFCVWMPTALLITTMYYTRSRGGVIALLAVLGLMFSRRISRVKTIILVGILGVALIAAGATGGRSISGDDDSSEGRLSAWGQGFILFFSSPLLGIGYNRFTEYNEITAHNSYVLCFSELGLAGYFLWLLILVASLLQLSALKKTEGTDPAAESIRQWAGTLQLCFCGYLVAGFFLSRSYVYILYVLAALTGALTMLARREELTFEFPKIPEVMRLAASVEFASMFIIYVGIRLNNLISPS
jgi:putative inorganic carbon (HCO3(-)) transporter